MRKQKGPRFKAQRRNRLKELWLNRPWKYLPDVFEFMREYPFNKKNGDIFRIWIRNCFYLNWQVWLE